MSGPLRQRRADQLRDYIHQYVKVRNNRGELITKGKISYISSRHTDGTKRNAGFYVGDMHIPLKSIITRGGITRNRVISINVKYSEGLDKIGEEAA